MKTENGIKKLGRPFKDSRAPLTKSLYIRVCVKLYEKLRELPAERKSEFIRYAIETALREKGNLKDAQGGVCDGVVRDPEFNGDMSVHSGEREGKGE